MTKRHNEETTNPKNAKIRFEHLIFDNNEYDRFGRNLAEQKKRQNAVKWTRVRYHKGRLVDRGPI